MDKTDPRLKAAELSEQEFTGTFLPKPGHDATFLLEAYSDPSLWDNLPFQQLMEPHEGYILRYTLVRKEPLVFLLFENKLAGIFDREFLMIQQSHRKKHLSRELILAAFAQAPWKDKEWTFTQAGAFAFRSAHRFVRKVADRLCQR